VELLVAFAAGLNPYAAGVVLAALAAFTGRVPLSETGTTVPGALWALAAVGYGEAMPIDFVLGKFVRHAPRLRAVSHVVAPLTGALSAVAVQQSDLPVPLVAIGGALVAWALNVAVTAHAARASRSPEWSGLGHIPVLMSAAVGAACMVPLGLALPGVGYGIAGLSLMMLGLAELDRRSPRPESARRGVARRGQVSRVSASSAGTRRRPAPATAAAIAVPSVVPALRNVGRASGRAYARAYAQGF
jgi:hypothetical protein